MTAINHRRCVGTSIPSESGDFSSSSPKLPAPPRGSSLNTHSQLSTPLYLLNSALLTPPLSHFLTCPLSSTKRRGFFPSTHPQNVAKIFPRSRRRARACHNSVSKNRPFSCLLSRKST